ncbi:ATP-binding protein [Chitiniphilus purpureus]|uniref:histidine kinase n=1 Tax=Chitiniphilus purpureus TaxID=2981137 RepID=A0ABY6DPE1_9NEIS|nr:ATP-binding protein [Chitiniphilus sp. CD1]UXY16254.1 ATP-binding protein [Chitiniphilus sp. CD1]
MLPPFTAMPRRVRIAFWITVSVLSGILILSAWFEQRLRAHLSGVSDYAAQEELWNTISLTREFMNVIKVVRLARYDPTQREELALRYDILASRVHTTQSGTLHNLYGMTQAYRQLLAPLNALFQQFDPLFEDGLDNVEIERLAQTLDQLEPQFHQTVQLIQERFSDQLIRNQRLIVALGEWRIALLVLQFLLLLFFAFIALRELWRSETRSRELEEARRVALDASAAKTRFLASVSHEMRTPLTAIIGYTEQVLALNSLPPAQRRQLEHVRQSGTYLSSLIGNVLDVSKIEAGRVHVVEDTVCMAEVATDLRGIFELQAASRGLQFTLTLDPAVPPYLHLDGGKWRQILINLIGNAIKFTEHGAVHAHIDALQPADKLMLRMQVIDTGLGISIEEQARLFNPFEQTASGKLLGGTGLGLVISRDYARHLGGDITVESVPGRGSTFTATVHAQPAMAPPPADEKDAPRLDGLKLVIAEDQEINRELMRDILTQAGAQVRATDNGLSVLDELTTDPACDCVLLDYNMPGLDGLAAARALRARGWSGRIVMISAGLQPEPDKLAAAGIDQWLPKPFSALRLLQAARGEVQEGAAPAAAVQSELLESLETMCGRLGCTPQRWLELAERGLARVETLLAHYANSDNTQDKQRHAHSARGIALQIGATALATALADLEQHPDTAPTTPVRECYAQTRAAVAELAQTNFLSGTTRDAP